MKTDCKYWNDCRKCLQLCNANCPDYISAKELEKERKEQLKEDFKNYQGREYHE